METKNIVATLYLKNGKAVKSTKDFTEIEDVYPCNPGLLLLF